MLERIKILYLIDKLIPAGTQNNLLEILKGLDREKFNPILVIFSSGGEMIKDFQAAGICVIEMPVGKAYGFSGIKVLGRLIQLMKKERVDIVQTHFLQADLLGGIAAKIAGVKKVITTRRDEGFWRSSKQLFLNRLLNGLNQRVLVNSQAVKTAALTQEKIAPAKIDVLYNGVDTEFYKPDETVRCKKRKELGLAKKDVAIGLVANMRHAIKGHRDLLEAFSIILKSHSNAKLLLVGEGNLRPSLEEFAEQLKIKHAVMFLGTRRDIPQLLNAMDITCLPSITEGFSNTVLECMAVGKPLVATRVGGNPEVVTEDTGILVPPQEAKQLAQALIKLIENPKQREEMGRLARARIIADFAIKKMRQNYESFYKNLCRVKVLHVIWSLDQGGAEQVVMNLARSLDRREFESIVCCLNDKGRYAEGLEKEGIKVIALQKRPKMDLAVIFKLAKVICGENIDVVHTHLFTSNLWGRIAAWLTGVPVISTEHNLDTWKSRYHFIADRILSMVNRRIIFVSRKVEEFYKKEISSLQGKSHVLYNGIDVSKFVETSDEKSLREQWGIGKDVILIGTVGRLVPQKKQVDFLEVIRLLKQENQNVFGVLVGDGPLREELTVLAREKGIEQSVRFLGFHSHMPAVYRTLDIFILSSEREGFPMTVLEAMVSGVAVIATNVGGVSECIKDSIDGFLVKVGDVKTMAEIVKWLIQEPALKEKIAVTAKKKIMDFFSSQKMARDHEKLYQEVLGAEMEEKLHVA